MGTASCLHKRTSPKLVFSVISGLAIGLEVALTNEPLKYISRYNSYISDVFTVGTITAMVK